MPPITPPAPDEGPQHSITEQFEPEDERRLELNQVAGRFGDDDDVGRAAKGLARPAADGGDPEGRIAYNFKSQDQPLHVMAPPPNEVRKHAVVQPGVGPVLGTVAALVGTVPIVIFGAVLVLVMVWYLAFGRGANQPIAAPATAPVVVAAPSIATATPSPTAAPRRAPAADHIVAIFDPPDFVTAYTVRVDNPDGQPLVLKWSGPNCGTWNSQSEERTATVALLTEMRWSHPHPPCAETTDHSDVTVTLSIAYDGGALICVYVGSESGNGPVCKKL